MHVSVFNANNIPFFFHCLLSYLDIRTIEKSRIEERRRK